MKISSRPLRRILPARIVRLLPYVLAAGLALLHLLVWFRFKGLEEAKRQKELQEAATDISRQIQKRIDFYGSELLALRSLFEASDQVTPADWKAFLRTMGADRDPVILDFAVGTISPQGAFRPYYSKTGNPGWLAEGTKARKRLVQQEEISPEVFPDPVLIKENGSGHQFQLFRLIRERGFLVAAIRLDGQAADWLAARPSGRPASRPAGYLHATSQPSGWLVACKQSAGLFLATQKRTHAFQ